MKTKVTSTTIVFKGISNESELEEIEFPVKHANCEIMLSNCQTVATIKGQPNEILKYVRLYNS